MQDSRHPFQDEEPKKDPDSTASEEVSARLRRTYQIQWTTKKHNAEKTHSRHLFIIFGVLFTIQRTY